MYKEITKEVIENSTFLAEGTTCLIVRTSSGEVYKIYKQALDYIKGSGIYNLDLEYETERLEFIVSHKDKIKNVRMPEAIVSFDGKPRLYEIVGEMIEHNIIPTDPNFENFMVRFNNGEPEIVMVDVDDIYVDVYPPGKSEVFKSGSIHSCYNVIDLSFQSLSIKK